jgi:hypothetical protein
MGAIVKEDQAPPPPDHRLSYAIPLQLVRTLHRNNSLVRQGCLDPLWTLMKTEKAIEMMMARNALLEKGLESVRAVYQLDQRARGSCDAQRFLSGQVFDPEYQAGHTADLAERKEQERVARDKRALKQEEGHRILLWSVSLGQVLLLLYVVTSL